VLFKRILLCAALALAAGQAHAEDCKLKQFASLDAIVKDNEVLLPVTLGGQPGGYFVLDFNALVSGIGDANADALHLKRSFMNSHLIVHLDGKLLREQAGVPLQLGGIKGDIVMGVIPQYAPSDKRIVGVIGTDLLGRFDVDLDLAHSKINLFSQDHCSGQVVYWTHEGAVAVAMNFRGQETFVVPMQLDGHDINASLSTDGTPILSSRIAHDTFGIDEAGPRDGHMPTHRFKTLSVDGLTISNPDIAIYEDNSGCNGTAKMKDVPLRTEHSVEFMQCYGAPDLTLALPELKRLHVYLAFRERMLYASAADAH
jgi:hypothetical protein